MSYLSLTRFYIKNKEELICVVPYRLCVLSVVGPYLPPALVESVMCPMVAESWVCLCIFCTGPSCGGIIDNACLSTINNDLFNLHFLLAK